MQMRQPFRGQIAHQELATCPSGCLPVPGSRKAPFAPHQMTLAVCLVCDTSAGLAGSQLLSVSGIRQTIWLTWVWTLEILLLRWTSKKIPVRKCEPVSSRGPSAALHNTCFLIRYRCWDVSDWRHSAMVCRVWDGTRSWSREEYSNCPWDFSYLGVSLP